jgi:cytochrome c peroxidase
MFIRSISFTLALASLGAAAQAGDPLQAISGDTIKQADPAIVELGKMLFFDPRLSGDASTACSDCHDPNYGWSDGSELARGYPGTMHWRNSQTIVNLGFITGGFHWDSGLASLSDQVHDAMGAGFVANIDTVLGEERLRQIPEYRQQFQEIWGEEPTQAKIADAIAAYERTIVSDDSPFDLYMSGQKDALSASAMRGMELFNGKANCSSCHNGPLATDQQFHNISVPPNTGLSDDPLRQVTFRYLMRVKGLDPAVSDGLDRDPGRYLATMNPDDLGLFRTPPLRYLAYTAPYMHNGIFYTLDEVVEFYDIGGTQDTFGTKSPLISPLGLSREEKADLVAFLESMSGSEIKTEVPSLPDYAIQAFPGSTATITAASLKSGDFRAATAPAVPDATTTGTLQMAPATETPSNGMIMKPKDASFESSASGDAAAAAKTRAGGVMALGKDRYVVVEPGDTLGSIASKLYGDAKQFQKLYDANRDHLRNPNALVAGMLLKVPE